MSICFVVPDREAVGSLCCVVPDRKAVGSLYFVVPDRKAVGSLCFVVPDRKAVESLMSDYVILGFELSYLKEGSVSLLFLSSLPFLMNQRLPCKN